MTIRASWVLPLFLFTPAVSVSFLATSADIAKDYPDRPIRVIVPNAPGSSVDTLNRILVTRLGGILGQTMHRACP